jgi:hypothetical protein
MSTVSVNNYVDDGRLVDPDLVVFLKKKLDKGDKLDLEGLTEVAGDVLDALFEGWTPEQVADAPRPTRRSRPGPTAPVGRCRPWSERPSGGRYADRPQQRPCPSSWSAPPAGTSDSRRHVW